MSAGEVRVAPVDVQISAAQRGLPAGAAVALSGALATDAGSATDLADAVPSLDLGL